MSCMRRLDGTNRQAHVLSFHTGLIIWISCIKKNTTK